MDSNDYWRLCDRLSIIEAALLICGEDPASDMQYVERKLIEQQPLGYKAAKTALVGWVENKQVEGHVAYEFERDMNGGLEETDRLDLNNSWIDVESLRQMLRRRGFSDGFFVQDERKARGYLDPANEFYSPKLAAAITAWEIVSSDSSLTNGKTPKQALDKWLREHASEYGLTGTDGNPVNAAIDQISKVANWKPEGGASKTPTHVGDTENLSPSNLSEENQVVNEEDPDPIPF